METEKKIRTQAKNALNGNWTAAAAGLFLIFALSLLLFLLYYFAVNIINIFNGNTYDGVYEASIVILICLLVLSGFALSPVLNGFFKICYNIANKKEADFSDAFYFFKRNKYFTTVQFNLIIAFKIILNFIVGLIPYFAVTLITGIFSLQLLNTVIANEVFFSVQAFLFALGATFAVIRSLRLFITNFLYIENDRIDFQEIFSISRKINKIHSKDLTLLFFTFLAWIASCFFVLPAIYVIPYFTTAFANSSKWLIQLYKEGKIE